MQGTAKRLIRHDLVPPPPAPSAWNQNPKPHARLPRSNSRRHAEGVQAEVFMPDQTSMVNATENAQLFLPLLLNLAALHDMVSFPVFGNVDQGQSGRCDEMRWGCRCLGWRERAGKEGDMADCILMDMSLHTKPHGHIWCTHCRTNRVG